MIDVSSYEIYYMQLKCKDTEKMRPATSAGEEKGLKM